MARIDVDHGTVLVTYGTNANSMIADSVLALQPYVAGNDVIWRCAHGTVPAGATAMDRGAVPSDAATDIETRYLPSACRP